MHDRIYHTVQTTGHVYRITTQSERSHTPASSRVSIDPSDSLDSVVPITDLVNWFSIENLCDNAAERLVDETARLV